MVPLRIRSTHRGNPPILIGVHPQSLRGHFKFLGGANPADTHVRAVIVVSPEPLNGVILGLLDAFDVVLAEPFTPDGAVVSLDVRVLLGLAVMGLQAG